MAWAPDYVTSAELKSYVKISDAVDDAEIGFAITAASRAVDQHTGRQFGVVAAAQERFYTACWNRRRGRWVVEFDDLMSVTGFAVMLENAQGVDVAAITDYVLEPQNAALIGEPWTQLVVRPTSTTKPTGLEGEMAITGLWGWSAVPTAVKQATLLQASRIFTRRLSPYGIAGSPDQGSELRLLARLDPDVAVTLAKYVRWWGAA